MKKRNNLLATAVAIIISIGALFTAHDVKAVNEQGGKQKLVQCQIVEEGTVIMYGGKCESGANKCISNPCY